MMMSLLDYANDVNLSVEEIKKLCDKLSIDYGDENYLLSDTEITLLDNMLEDVDDAVKAVKKVLTYYSER